jgi:hypothetical protein
MLITAVPKGCSSKIDGQMLGACFGKIELSLGIYALRFISQELIYRKYSKLLDTVSRRSVDGFRRC